MNKVVAGKIAMELKGAKSYKEIVQEYSKIDQLETVTFFYWFTDYSTLQLALDAGYETNSSVYLANNIIKPMKANLVCKKCGTSSEILMKCRKDYIKFKEIKDNYCCDECSDNYTSEKSNTNVDYYEYLKTDKWKVVRRLALDYAGHKCQLCSSKERLNVHHNNYLNLGNETLKDVVVLCRKCHEKFHNIKAEVSNESN